MLPPSIQYSPSPHGFLFILNILSQNDVVSIHICIRIHSIYKFILTYSYNSIFKSYTLNSTYMKNRGDIWCTAVASGYYILYHKYIYICVHGIMLRFLLSSLYVYKYIQYAHIYMCISPYHQILQGPTMKIVSRSGVTSGRRSRV